MEQLKPLSEEDIKFLRDLQHELNTQETDCQAAPRFWVVAENKREFGFESGYSDGTVMCGTDGDTWETPEKFIEFLIENEHLQKIRFESRLRV